MRVTSTSHLARIRHSLAALLAAVVILVAQPHAAQAQDWELVLIEQHGCAYCARWNRDVAPEYPLTPEGRFAPLRRVDLRQPLPDDLAFDTRPVFTPTFILMRDGAEVSRLEGYPGEDFFWGLLGRMLDTADAAWMTRNADG
ncbi:thioredoxin domain-containing protein [Roseicyclus marinus]|uniref:hypothetical protein n=1 Tax=Roseicyclus marinus TaxID=2161673 RepID=UPI0024107B46|nr:hypothetical protein [Roseicyclus marinus]MDG3040297.1 hypothetical protein [Roseicyclus marinus]